MKLKPAHFLFLLAPILPLLFLFFLPGHAFLTRDVSLAYLPAKKFWVDSVLEFHRVPGWNPLAYGGIPYRADLNHSPLHPLNILFLLFPQAIDQGYLLFLGVHLFFLTIGAYFLFQRLRFGARGALAAAVALGVSGVSYSTMSLMNVAASFAAFPFFLYFLLRLRKKFLWGELIGMSVAWAYPIYSGDPQFSYWMALLAIGMVAERCARERSPIPIFRTCGAGVLALGLGAAQILPALRLAVGSERGITDLSLNGVERFSLHPLRILELFFPLPFGNPGIGIGHWVNRLTDPLFTMPFFLHVYLGVALGFFTIWRVGRTLSSGRPNRRDLYFLASALLLLFTACGKYFPVDFYATFYSIIPGWGIFRYPERLTVLFVLLLLVWNGAFFRLAVRKMHSTEAVGVWPLRVALVFLLIAFFSFMAQGLVRVLEVHTLAASLLHVSFFGALYFLLWHMRGNFPALTKYSFVLFCALLVLDAVPYGSALLWKSSASEVPYRENSFAQKVLKHIKGRPEQILRGAATRYFHGTYTGAFPTPSQNPLQIGQAWDWGVMYPNVSMYFGIANPAGYSPFDPKEILGLWAKHGNSDPQRLLNLFSVAYYPIPTGENKPSLQFNPSALPQAWFPEAATFLPGDIGRETALFSAKFPYLKRAVLEGEAGSWEQKKSWEVESYKRTPDHVVVKVRPSSNEAYFVWNERYSENWAAYFRGERIPIVLANTWAMAVKLTPQAGEQILEFRYEDSSAKLGNWITAITLALILIATAGTRLLLYRRSRE